MALNTKIIKRRIRSIGSTKKITKAMEMMSAVKMRRAVANVLATRNYSTLAWEMLQEISKKTDISAHPLLSTRNVKRVGIILITSNRGLAGGFGSRLLQATNNYITQSKIKGNVEMDVILTGRQGKKIYQKFGHNVVAEFDKIDLTTKMEEVLPMTKMAVTDFISGRYDAIVVAYTDYVSAITQTPRIKQILPLQGEDKELGNIKTSGQTNTVDEDADKDKDIESIFLYEPGARAVLDVLLPRLVEMQIYQAILESDASEHSARMVAMKNASDAANEMIKELNYTFNKARQAAITQEISEIVGGVAALE